MGHLCYNSATMNNFNYQNELKKIVQSKQLVQVHRNSTTNEFKAAYIVSIDDKYLTLIEVANDGTPFGVSIRHMDEVDVIKVETIYLSELAKHVNRDALYQQAMKSIENIKRFTFDGFASGLENTNTIVEVLKENGDVLIGRIVGHDDKILVLDEYREETDRRFARCYITFEIVAQISVDIPYLNIITQSLTDKNL